MRQQVHARGAEGVEDHDTSEALLALGCGRIQGYLLGRPIPETQLHAWLDSGRAPSPEVIGAANRPTEAHP